MYKIKKMFTDRLQSMARMIRRLTARWKGLNGVTSFDKTSFPVHDKYLRLQLAAACLRPELLAISYAFSFTSSPVGLLRNLYRSLAVTEKISNIGQPLKPPLPTDFIGLRLAAIPRNRMYVLL